jgi:4-hydroxy-tetrahydrodipicolinate reductase
MAVNIIVNGACGRMGREVVAAVLDDPEAHLVGALEREDHECIGQAIDTGAAGGEGSVRLQSDFRNLPAEDAVIIDFSSPEGVGALLDNLAGMATRLVIATTGVDNAGLEALKSAAQRIPVVYSPNMSRGINLLFHLTEQLCSALGSGFDVEIVEAHHRMKKDAPSGTARKLADTAASALGLNADSAFRHGRQGMVGERSTKEIGIHAVRGGDIVGDHTVLFAGQGERIELKHTAHSRATFAQGAVQAAKWLVERPNGLYSMRDVLGL